VGQGFIENDWLLDFLYKFITKQDACSGVHAGLADDKIPSQYSKNNLKYLDVLDFLTAVTSWSQHSEYGIIKIHAKPIRVQWYISSSACAMKYNKIRPTITASKICNVVKYEIRS
jgi:hypothetical protein